MFKSKLTVLKTLSSVNSIFFHFSNQPNSQKPQTNEDSEINEFLSYRKVEHTNRKVLNSSIQG